MRTRFISCLVALFGLYLYALAQNTIKVTGTVTDDKGAAIPAASIQIKGVKGGTATGNDGSFSISAKPGATIIISAVGFENKQVSATASLGSISLVSDTKTLGEIVVTGIGVATSKKKLGISVETVSSDKLPQIPTNSLDQALVGKIAGAQISSTTGTPGAPASILLRGINTIQNGTKPLILLDGIQVNSTDLNTLDASAIDRVEVVQGAGAATIYGAQGANGVIQLFSKKGKKGILTIDVNNSVSFDAYINKGKVHKATKHSFKTDASGNVIDNAGNIVELDENGVYQGVTWAYAAGSYAHAMANPLNVYNKSYDHNLKYYDHFKQLFANANSINNNVIITGGGDKVDYSFGMSHSHQTSAITQNGFVDRTNLSSNIGIELFKGFKLRSITQLIYTRNTLHPGYGTGNSNIFNVMNVAPFVDLTKKLDDGNYPYAYYPDNAVTSVNGYNPFYDFQYTQSRDNKIDIVQNLQANYVVNKFLELDAKYGVNYTVQDINYIYKNQTGNINSNYESSWAGYYNGSDNTGEIDNFNYRDLFQNFLATAYIRTDFRKDFGWNVPITTSTQLTFDHRRTRSTEYITYGYSLPTYEKYNMGSTASQQVVSDLTTPFITYGYLINQKVDIGDYGGFSGGVRRDYSSAFGQGSKLFTFPRGDAYVRLSSFNFWQNGGIKNTISEFKLRGAYGKAGIQPQPFDRYVTLSTTNIGNGLAFYLPTAQKNPNLDVEVSTELELGTDVAIKGLAGRWLNQVNVSATYWKRKTDNAIYNVSAAPSTGANTVKDNAITLVSHGLQASLNVTAFESRNFTWNFTTNFNKQVSKVDAIKGGDIILTTSAGATSLVLTPGQNIGQIYGYKAIRSLDEKRLNGTSYLAKEDYGKYGFVDGMLVDTTTKAIQFTNDKFSLGNTTPKFNMSFINSFTYKNFLTFSFQFDWIYGAHLYNQTKEWMYRDGIHGDFDKPITINGQTQAYTAFYRSAYAAYFGDLNGAARNGTKDYYFEGSSFLRLRNIALGFDLAQVFPIKTFRKLQLVLSGRNLLTVTKYSGFDPEINSSSSTNSAWDRGIDHNSMPNVRSYQVALNIGF
ncbi:TonB-linked outer membrane protein, SusC/RagA family [Filimonas lacunae]|uniref:TonB-linked outer membrane protein, SusC/RagA family n=1 Tax=Filimonas lacunae TaxID=477680 RepID=A0A173MIM3_9BACT|nr:SusC/RagA family TonB-linked outer membrane protein [Filimonas lacunae]BAV07483.1 outer membrane protein, nutrient binding [Filimonas lacunae]SIT30211.1 TonB-linked outer membrane protein, SusC/RagA family [Filimonas lacunae]